MNVIENLKVLIAAVEATPDDTISLRMYRQAHSCGTLYCAAGLVPTIPHFIEMGVTAYPMGAPKLNEMRVDDTLNSLFWPTDHTLHKEHEEAFLHLFDTYGSGTWDDDLMNEFDHTGNDTPNDKELVLLRLKYHLKNLQEQAGMEEQAAEYNSNRDNG